MSAKSVLVISTSYPRAADGSEAAGVFVAAGLAGERIEPTTTGLEAAGAMACLALAAPLEHAAPWRKVLAVPVLAFAVLAINLGAWLLSRVWPAWPSLCIGLRVELRKP